jgi:hypothetical protein
MKGCLRSVLLIITVLSGAIPAIEVTVLVTIFGMAGSDYEPMAVAVALIAEQQAFKTDSSVAHPSPP